MSLREVGQKAGISRERVRQILKGAGYKIRSRGGGRKFRPFPLDYAIALRQQGLGIAAIALEVGRDFHTVSKRLTEAGITGNVKRPLTPIGCNNCKIKPVARGLCRTCYTKWIRRGRPERG